jgi:hypothetical protein
MARRTFTIHAKWDPDAKVYYSESDIIGLHVEAETLDEFERVVMIEAPDLVVANHMTGPEMARARIADLIPSIIMCRPDTRLVVSC